MLLQTFSRWVVKADYVMNQNFIATVLCINKEKPALQCKGKCYLVKQLKEQQQQDQPSQSGKKIKFDTELFSVAHTSQLHVNPLFSIKHISKDPGGAIVNFPTPVFRPPSLL